MDLQEAIILYPNYNIIDVRTDNKAIFIECSSKVKEAICPFCKTLSKSRHHKYKKKLQDIPYEGKAVYLIVNIVGYRCKNDDCARTTFTESLVGIPPAGMKTTKLLDYIIKKTRNVPYRKAALLLIEEGIVINDSTANKIEKKDRRKRLL